MVEEEGTGGAQAAPRASIEAVHDVRRGVRGQREQGPLPEVYELASGVPMEAGQQQMRMW